MINKSMRSRRRFPKQTCRLQKYGSTLSSRDALPQKTKLKSCLPPNSIHQIQAQGEKQARSSYSEQIVYLILSTHIAWCLRTEIPLWSRRKFFSVARSFSDIYQMSRILSVGESLHQGSSL